MDCRALIAEECDKVKAMLLAKFADGDPRESAELTVIGQLVLARIARRLDEPIPFGVTPKGLKKARPRR